MSTDFRAPDDTRNNDYWYNFGYDALTLDVEEYAFGDHEPGHHGIGDHQLHVGTIDWDTLTITGTVEVPNGLVEYVFEDGVDPNDAGEILIVGDCKQTHNRFVGDQIRDSIESGTHQFEVTFDRSEFAGEASLTPVLVRRNDPDVDTTTNHQYGQTEGLRLADGPSYKIVFDSEEEGPGSFLEIKTKEFDENPSEDQIFHLDHSVASEPTLWINSRVDLLPAAMQNRAPYGRKRWMREVLERMIGQPVWVELVLWTAADISDGECSYSWQEDVLEILSTNMYDDASPDEIAEDLEDRAGSPEQLPHLIEETNLGMQEFLDPKDDLENLLEEVM